MKNVKTYTLDYISYLKGNKEINIKMLHSLNNYLDMIKNNSNIICPIFRGSNYVGNNILDFKIKVFDNYKKVYVNYIKPKKNRISLTSENENDSLINLWTSNNSDWKEYPSRKYNANICTFDYEYAEEFGTCQIVIPLNFQDTKFGICPNEDMIFSFSKRINTHLFSDLIKNLLRHTTNTFNIGNLFQSYEQIIDILNYIQTWFEKIRNDNNFDKKSFLSKLDLSEQNMFLEMYNLQNNTTIFDYFANKTNPEINGFKSCKNIIELFNIIKNKKINGNEIWFNGDFVSIIVDTDFYYTLTNKPNLYIQLIEDTINNIKKK